MSLPGIVYLVLFRYIPIAGAQLAFKKFIARAGIWGSPWVGFQHFQKFFDSYQFSKLLGNTLILSVMQLVWSFPIPILLALMLNQMNNQRFRKVSQTILYAPYFISTVVLVGMLQVFFSVNIGIFNNMLAALGFARIEFLSDPSMFRPLYIFSGIWQSMGYNSIIYLAALTSVSPDLHEAAVVDGATKAQRILHIDLPSILPTVVIMLILSVGRMMTIGFEKAYLMQNARNLGTAEIISTFVYKIGIQQAQYEYATAIDLFNSIINLLLMTSVNYMARRVGETSLW
jgi:putative aldouronate transport system permease protein